MALAAGRAAEIKNPEDGGSCNFDSPAILLPKWKKSLVEQAAREAGCYCSVWSTLTFETKTGREHPFIFTPDTHAQGNARTRNAEAMAEKLKELDYDAMMYYQMD